MGKLSNDDGVLAFAFQKEVHSFTISMIVISPSLQTFNHLQKALIVYLLPEVQRRFGSIASAKRVVAPTKRTETSESPSGDSSDSSGFYDHVKVQIASQEHRGGQENRHMKNTTDRKFPRSLFVSQK